MPLPFLLWCLAEGLGPAAVYVLAAFLASQAVFAARPWLARDHQWQQPELSRTYEWLRRATLPQEILASAMYVRDGFYAGRPSLPLPAEERDEDFYRVLKSHRARYVLWQEGLDLGLTLDENAVVRRQLGRSAQQLKNPKRFRAVYENPEERSHVYELH
jgi:hypothetical protein